MGNIIGQPLDGYVAKQIEARQALHGSGVRFDFNERTTDQLNILTSNTAWVKLASGVSMATGSEGNDRLKELGFTTTERENLKGMGLAKNYVLFNGISKYTDKEQELNSRQGFNPTDFQEVFDSEGNSKGATSIDDGNSSYIYTRNRRLNETHSSDSGYVPMPGIISMEVKALNRGSLEKAFVKIKAYSRQQLDILDVLYMRLGYTVLLEWGNSLYTTDGKDKKIVYNTVIEDKFFEFEGNRSYLDFIGGTSNSLINSYKDKYKGNYDGMLAIVSNFSWTFNPDGSYDIDLTLISMGDVIESLKTNISIDNGLVEYIKTYTPPGTEESDQIEEHKDASIIHSMLWLFKRFGPNSRGIYINSNSTDPSVLVGNFLNNGDTTLTTITKTYIFKYPTYLKYEKDTEGNTISIQQYETSVPTPITGDNPDEIADKKIIDRYKADWGVELEVEQSGNTHYIERSTGVNYEWKAISRTANVVPNPIDDASYNTAFKLNTDIPQYYLKFHYLLEFIRNKIIPLVKSDKDAPLFDIDLSQWTNHMYSLPNQISLDPKVCLVRNDRFLKADGSTSTVMHELALFRAIDGKNNTNYNLAYPLNVYLNFNFIIKSLEDNQNDRGDVNIYGFISSICTGLNRALGGVNNLEPVIDKDNNILKIIDGTPIPNISCPDNDSYSLNLYGYQPSNFDAKLGSNRDYSSNFIRNVDLKTTITPEYATMVTVGATANGYVKGTEATAFSVWNRGIVDRFKNELISSNPSSQPTSGGDEAVTNYVGEFLSKTSQCYGFSSYRDPFLNGNLGDLNDDIISKNISIVTEFYKYIIAKKGQTSKQAGTIGFIPFKLGITMDGISGIKIYNKLNVNSSFLPIRYGDTLNFIITGVSHRLQNNDWETSLDTIVMPKTSKMEVLDIGITSISNLIRTVPINTTTPKTPTGNKATGDLYIWVNGPNATAPGFPNAYLTAVLNGIKITGTPIPAVGNPIKLKSSEFKPNSSGNLVKVDKYFTFNSTPTEDQQFYKDILTKLGASHTQGNLIWMKAWRQAEGGSAPYNPWNSTKKQGVASNYNTIPVQNYFTKKDGINATYLTMINPYYPNIIKALRKGIPTQAEGYKLAKLLQERNPNQSSIDTLINSW
jgi:hypothetical protein